MFTLANKARATSAKLTVAVTTGTYTSVIKVEANGQYLGDIRVTPQESFDKGYEEVRTYTLNTLHAVDSIKLTTLSGGPARLDYLIMTYSTPAPAPSLKASFPAPE